jgi:hypothetical protein
VDRLDKLAYKCIMCIIMSNESSHMHKLDSEQRLIKSLAILGITAWIGAVLFAGLWFYTSNESENSQQCESELYSNPINENNPGFACIQSYQTAAHNDSVGLWACIAVASGAGVAVLMIRKGSGGH